MYDGVLVARDGPYAARPRSFLPACFQSVSTAGRPPRAPEVFVFLPARKEDVLTRLEQLSRSPVLLWALTSGPKGGPDDAVFLSYRLGHSVTHKKIDAGPLLVAPVPRSRRRTANAPLEVHLSGVRFARLLQVAAELVPKLRRLLADISRQRNFFGVALDDEQVAARLRVGPLLYAAPWGGGLRIVVPNPYRAKAQRRGELRVDWAALPAGRLLLVQDSDGSSAVVSSLQEAMGIMGAFAAPRAVATALRALSRMRTKALERRARMRAAAGAAGGDADESSEPTAQELEETATEVIKDVILRKALRLREERQKRGIEAAETGHDAGGKQRAATAAAPAATSVDTDAHDDGTHAAAPARSEASRSTIAAAAPAVEKATGDAPPSASKLHRTQSLPAKLVALSAEDAARTAVSALDKLVGLLQPRASSSGDVMAAAHTCLDTLAMLMCIPAQGCAAVRACLDEAGFPELCIYFMALREGHHVLVFPAARRAGMLLRDHSASAALLRQTSAPASPFAAGSSRHSPEGSPARYHRQSSFAGSRQPVRMLSPVQEAHDNSAPRLVSQSPSGSPAVSIPKLRLPDGPSADDSIGDDDDSGVHADGGPSGSSASMPMPPDDIVAHILADLLLAVLTPDGASVCVTRCTPNSALPLALCVLQGHVRSRSGAALLPAIVARIAKGPLREAAAQLLRLLSPQLWWSAPLYQPGARLGRGAYALVYAVNLQGPAETLQARLPAAAGAAGSAALKVCDAPPPMRARSLTVAAFNTACERACAEVGTLRDVFAEVAALRALSPAHIVPQLLDYGALGDGYAVVLERCCCTLRSWRGSHEDVALSASRLYAAVYAACLECFAQAASLFAVHLDIKADNVLLQPRPGVAGTAAAPGPEFWAPTRVDLPDGELPFTVLLSDWGCSRLYVRESPPQTEADGQQDSATNARASVVGTPRHTGTECIKSPEMLRAGARAAGAGTGGGSTSGSQEQGPGSSAFTSGSPADVWAAGCLLHDVFCGAPLYGNEAERQWVRFFVRLTSPGEPLIPEDASQALGAIHPALEQFLNALLKRQPSARPSMGAASSRWHKLMRSTLASGLPAYIPPTCTQPRLSTPTRTSSEDGEWRADLGQERTQCVFPDMPVQVTPGLWIGKQQATKSALMRAAGDADLQFSVVLRCSCLPDPEVQRRLPTDVRLPMRPGRDCNTAIDAALDQIAGSRGKPVLLTTDSKSSSDCAVTGAIAAAWLLRTRVAPDVMAALTAVADVAPGAAADASVGAVLCGWERQRPK